MIAPDKAVPIRGHPIGVGENHDTILLRQGAEVILTLERLDKPFHESGPRGRLHASQHGGVRRGNHNVPNAVRSEERAKAKGPPYQRLAQVAGHFTCRTGVRRGPQSRGGR